MLTEFGQEELEQYQDIYGEKEGNRVFQFYLSKMKKKDRIKLDR